MKWEFSGVVPASWNIFPLMPSLRFSASPRRCYPKSAKILLSAPNNSKILKLLSDFHPRHPISGLCRVPSPSPTPTKQPSVSKAITSKTPTAGSTISVVIEGEIYITMLLQ